MEQLNPDVKDRHLRSLVTIGFYASVLAGLVGWLFPPDFTVDPPRISEISLMMGHLQTALIILGCTALGIKLGEEKQTLASIGFTMMAITEGVIFVLYVVSPEPSRENLDEVYKLFAASLFLLVPSMLIIARYTDFPKWLRLLGILAMVPWIVENIMYVSVRNLTSVLGTIDFIGQLLLNITVFFWGWYTWRRKHAI